MMDNEGNIHNFFFWIDNNKITKRNSLQDVLFISVEGISIRTGSSIGEKIVSQSFLKVSKYITDGEIDEICPELRNSEN